MHKTSYEKMEYFAKEYLDPDKKYEMLDIGSMNINGTYRPIFDNNNWSYSGCDLSAGDNVDIVLNGPYNWENIRDETYDIVISGQTFEHIEFFWITILEIRRITKQNGLICIIAPSTGPEHKYPVDCWRFYPDGFRALAKYANLELLEVFTDWNNGEFEDTFVVYKKVDDDNEQLDNKFSKI